MNSHEGIYFNLSGRGWNFQCLVRGLARGRQPVNPKLMNGKTFVKIGVDCSSQAW